jgi:hypothetical protein
VDAVEPYIEVIRPDGRTDRHPLRAARVTVGRSREADLAVVEAAELEPLHLLLAPRADGCWVSTARDAVTPVLVSGQALEHGLVEWGTELDVGALTFRLSHSEADRGRRTGTLKSLVLLAMALATGSVVLGMRDGGGGLPRPGAAPPALFSDESPECPERGGAAAAQLAREARDGAFAREQRYPFDPREGVHAVHDFAIARACFAAARDAAEQTSMAREQQRLRARIDEDYQVHCLRLEQAVQASRYVEALVESRLLVAYLDHLEGAYPDWLTQMERLLHIEVDKQLRNAKTGPKHGM